MSNKIYQPINRLPVAKFYYKGNHSHPVRRTVLIIEENKENFIGYEIREGKNLRPINQVSKYIKTYKKNKIAKWGDYSKLISTAKTLKKKINQSTLERFPISGILKD